MRFVLMCSLLGLFACDTSDVGLPCTDDPAFVEGLAVAGQVRLARDPNFDNCQQALCLSVDGADGICTRECESDAACPASFACGTPVVTGPFACRGYEENGTCEGVEQFIRYCEPR